jgi:hypothetical protein
MRSTASWPNWAALRQPKRNDLLSEQLPAELDCVETGDDPRLCQFHCQIDQFQQQAAVGIELPRARIIGKICSVHRQRRCQSGDYLLQLIATDQRTRHKAVLQDIQHVRMLMEAPRGSLRSRRRYAV